jgi:hypothetical protein
VICGSTGRLLTGWLTLWAFAIASAFAACSAQRHGAKTHDEAAAASNSSNQPSATIQISYAHKDDFLRSVAVTKFIGAQMIPTKPGEEARGASIVRFSGGVPVWEIHADESVGREILTEVPLIGAGRKFALKQVTYGTLPKNFLQTNPDAEPPEPIQNGSYYVFRVERASGSINFQAVKVDSDGSIEAYDAEPRAGDSYALCCNVTSDFASSAGP